MRKEVNKGVMGFHGDHIFAEDFIIEIILFGCCLGLAHVVIKIQFIYNNGVTPFTSLKGKIYNFA